LTTLYNFDFANGGYMPISDLALSGNTLYGTTEVGNGSGTVFKINTDGSGYTVLHSFTNLNDGEFPYAGVIVSGDTLYGTTETGGPSGNGTIFSLSTSGTNFMVVYDFSGDTDGANPVAPLILSNGVLYGTTQNGGCNGKGTVFAVNTDGTGYTNLYCFNIGPDGYNPVAGLVLSGNTLYGTAGYGSSGSGGSPFGTVFKVNTDSSGFATLHRFTAAGDDGANPLAALVLSGNTLYGTTDAGGFHGNGTVFKIDTDGNQFLTLYDFPTPTQGYDPTGVLALNGDTLYGTTQEGLRPSYGMVFQLSTNGAVFAPVHIFTNGIDGGNPYAGALLSGTTLYGTTSQGGNTGSGVVFALSLNSTPPPLAVSARMSPDGLVLNWSDPSFTLQAAVALTGSFTNVPGATSPFTNSLPATQGFFRLSRP
jgi:uncharacterized repeat protein (TIGR03803 family)